ncbi:MAG: hypothetical protein ACOC7U_07770 [Spirochaetota bacterium]
MKENIQLRILAIVVLIVLGVLDAFAIFVPVVAIGGIILLLFRPKWFYNFVEKVYK